MTSNQVMNQRSPAPCFFRIRTYYGAHWISSWLSGTLKGCQRMIRLNESDTEFFLYVPFQQKELAKGIDGRRWDPDRRCWAFPKTARVFDAIVGEFGDDLGTITVTRPDASLKKPTPDPESENVTLREELVMVRFGQHLRDNGVARPIIHAILARLLDAIPCAGDARRQRAQSLLGTANLFSWIYCLCGGNTN